jgi:hypothetical protein
VVDIAQRDGFNPRMRPGEDVRVIDNRVQVSGQVAVMAINALLAKVIFDKNPTNEFFIEESFPLEWMYPHLTPFGIIMKINRERLPELSQDIVDKETSSGNRMDSQILGGHQCSIERHTVARHRLRRCRASGSGPAGIPLAQHGGAQR